MNQTQKTCEESSGGPQATQLMLHVEDNILQCRHDIVLATCTVEGSSYSRDVDCKLNTGTSTLGK